MRIRLVIVLALAGSAGYLLAAPAPKENDAKKIQGTWIFASVVRAGVKQPDESYKDWKIVFTADKAVIQIGDRTIQEYAMKIDPAKKPKTIDLTQGIGDNATKELGIYELKGDTLIICNDDSGVTRPEKFESKAESKEELLTFKRVKP